MRAYNSGCSSNSPDLFAKSVYERNAYCHKRSLVILYRTCLSSLQLPTDLFVYELSWTSVRRKRFCFLVKLDISFNFITADFYCSLCKAGYGTRFY